MLLSWNQKIHGKKCKKRKGRERDGKQIKNIDHSLNKALEKAGINDFTFHGFRHTYITRKLLEGVSPVIISKVVGTTMKVIMEHYAHIKKEDLKQVFSSNDSGDNFRRNFGFYDLASVSTGEN
ncbi:MAG: tyrosine-type recombinase/integrase [Candidatus Hodarchaeota archaeon]